MDEEKGLVSPISGGVRAIRRNISSNMFVPRRRNEPQKPDQVTTNLLTTQSLQLRNVSRQLELISSTMVGINLSLSGVKESLALSQQLENQREQAKRNRERRLAEQGLREGKESALEKKIQNALQLPLKRVAAKAQGVLFNFQKFFLFLAGGWLTNVGIDLINALVTGNTDLINKLKLKFTVGLVAIGTAFTAFNVGFKLILFSLRNFVTVLTKLAFGGIIRTTFNGFRLLLKNVAIRAGLATAPGFFGGGLGTAAAAAGGTAIVAGGVETKMEDAINRFLKEGNVSKIKIKKKFNPNATRFNNKINPFTNIDIPKFGERIKIDKKFSFKAPEIPKKLTGFTSKVPKVKVPGFLTKGNNVLQVLFALQRFNERRSEGEGNLQAGVGTAAETIGGLKGFSIGASLFATKAFPLLAIPVVGKVIYAIGTLLSGIATAMFGSAALGFISDKILGLLGVKKDPPVKQLTLEDTEVVPISNLSEEEQKKLGVFEPVKRELANLQENDSSSVTVLQDDNQQLNNNNSNVVAQRRDAKALPGISFNDNNPHTMFSVMQMGVA